jgi:hypothetical protein
MDDPCQYIVQEEITEGPDDVTKLEEQCREVSNMKVEI